VGEVAARSAPACQRASLGRTATASCSVTR
jgi:hypothetical protein